MNLLLLLAAAIMSTVSATEETALVSEASQAFRFGTPTFFGSGCPADSVRLVTSTDGQSVSVLFSDYIAGTTKDKKRVRKSCNLAVPVDIGRGFSVGIFRVDYRGYAYVPRNRGSYSKFNVEYYWAGARGPTSSKTYRSGFDDDIFLSHKLGAIAWSPCGASTNFRINTAITAYKKQSWQEDPEIAIDTIDATVERGFRYYFKWRRC